MTDWQRNEYVANIGDPSNGGFEVYAARWPGFPGGREPAVMWTTAAGYYHYLPPWVARQFAAALTEAAGRIEADAARQAATTTGKP